MIKCMLFVLAVIVICILFYYAYRIFTYKIAPSYIGIICCIATLGIFFALKELLVKI